MLNNGWFLWTVLILTVVIAKGFSEWKKQEESRAYRLMSEQTLSGTVDRISYNRIFVRTNNGIRVFKIAPSRQPKFAAENIARGNRIVLSFDPDSYQMLEVGKAYEDKLEKNPVFFSNPPADLVKFAQTRAE